MPHVSPLRHGMMDETRATRPLNLCLFRPVKPGAANRASSDIFLHHLLSPFATTGGIFRNSSGESARRVILAFRIAPLK